MEIGHDHLPHDHFIQILKDVDGADIEVTDWEARFIESNLKSRTFTRKQKQVITDLEKRYLTRKV